MTFYEQTLLGELIGLARATEGNEHLITASVTELTAEILTVPIADEAQFVAYNAKIDSVKREMVPDCFHCENPCGRTAAFNFKTLEGESDQVRKAKFSILDELRAIAGSQRSRELELKLYRGLVLLGLEGYSSEELTTVFTGS